MRKLTAILVSITYLVLSTGLMVNLHYCQGEIESVSIIAKNSTCCCGTMDFDDGCCHNEQLLIQLDSDQQIVSSSVQFSVVFKFIETENYEDQFNLKASTENEVYVFRDLSPPPKIAIWKANCAFLFYG